jgi:hypothetical protein
LLLCLLSQAASLFPEAFGLERHRLRLRAGASEKLKLSFLPFQMPPLQQQQPAAPDGQTAAPKALTRSLLVLSDGDCGEFAYELCGEVLLPASFLEHKATVGLQGPQVMNAAGAGARCLLVYTANSTCRQRCVACPELFLPRSKQCSTATQWPQIISQPHDLAKIHMC